MKILVDANVILDALLERQPFFTAAVQVLGLSRGGVALYVSASSVTDIYYIIRKAKQSKETAAALLKNILSAVDVAAVTGDEIRRAFVLDWNDFEDAVQYAAGESLGVDYIVSRDTSGFVSAALPVVSPEKLLGILVGSNPLS